MKESSSNRASHVNSGTSVSFESGHSDRAGLRHPKLQAEVERNDSSPYGGLSLAAALVRSIGLGRSVDKAVKVLKEKRPYSESDHVLTQVYNLYIGGSSIEDISYLQCSESARRILGARRLPDPTTAGDFLRRFDEANLRALDQVIDDAHEQVWRRAYGRKKRACAYVDLDSHVHAIYGEQKEGADYTYKGTYGYHPFVISLAQTQEVLRLHNRYGNVASADGVAAELERVMPLLTRNFKTVIVRGDSAFARQDVYEVCEDFEQYFAVVSPSQPNYQSLAESVPERVWKGFRAHGEQQKPHHKARRKRGKNLRSIRARERGMRDLKLQRQWLAEVPYKPDRTVVMKNTGS